MDKTPSTAFLEYSSYYLSSDYLPKIKRCIQQLSEEEIWWRPNEKSNSVGNLILHLTGNLRQWIVSGVGGREDTRKRHREFEEVGPVATDKLMFRFEQIVQEACEVLSNLDPAILHEQRIVQGNDVTLMSAIYHAVEHFSTHTGQIIYIAKLIKGQDMLFYEVDEKGIATKNW